MLKHVVFFRFKPAATEAAIIDLEKSLAALPHAIPEIKSYEFGRDMVRSERSCDFALVSSFENIEAMKRYQTHPDHVVVINKVRGLCDDVLAVDFEF